MINLKSENDIPEIKSIHTNGLNIHFIDYTDPNYLCFTNVLDNGDIDFCDSIKNCSNFNENSFYELYYDTILQFLLENNIKSCLEPVFKKYKIAKCDTGIGLKHIEILKSIYDCEDNMNDFNKSLLIETNVIKLWKRYKFIKEDKRKKLFRHTKKGMEFLMEFNSKFWTERYKNLMYKYEQNFKNYYITMKYLSNDVSLALKKERSYINSFK